MDKTFLVWPLFIEQSYAHSHYMLSHAVILCCMQLDLAEGADADFLLAARNIPIDYSEFSCPSMYSNSKLYEEVI